MENRFFKGLNYTLANEDTSLELRILPEGTGHVFAVAGSGSRVLPLFSKFPSAVTCVDISLEQLLFTEMRIAALEAFSLEEFKSFFGYPGKEITSEQRRRFFYNLKLSERAQRFNLESLQRNQWSSPLYFGRWEQAMARFSRLNRFITGRKALKLFDQLNLAGQERFLRNEFPRKLWLLAVFLLGNAGMFNALFYKGSFPKKNINGSYYSFYLNALESLFRLDLARRNFLLQLLFLGRLKFEDGLPVECDEKVFNRAKKGLKNAQVSYICGEVTKVAANSVKKIDFLSMSDVPSYFDDDRAGTFLQTFGRNISPGGLIVNRYYMRIPKNIDSRGYENITNEFSRSIRDEKTQMYFCDIYKKK